MSRRARLLLLGLVVACATTGLLTFRALHGQTFDFVLAGASHELLVPEALALLCVLPLVAFAAWQSLTDMSPTQRALSCTLRALLVTALATALARPVRVEHSDRVAVVLAVDVSDSIDNRTLAHAQAFVDEVAAARGDNDLTLVRFAARPQRSVVPHDGRTPFLLSRAHADTTATDLQAAVQLAYGLFPSQASRRIVLVSDGNETRGDVAAEAARAKRIGVRIDARYFHDAPPPEVAARELELPQPLALGKPFRARAHLFATVPTRARVQLFQDDVPNPLDATRELELPRGDSSLDFESVVRVPGRVAYRLEVTPLGPDRFTTNNRVSASASVVGKPRVLVIGREPEKLAPLANALARSDLEAELRSPVAMPRSDAELDRYDFVMLSDVPYEQLPQGSLEAIERYVRDRGGAFLLAGGEQSFGLGGYQGTRMEQLMPVRMAAERRRDEASLALALVIDCSGSMVGQKMDLAKEAARATAEVLGDGDQIEVIGFSSQPERRVRLQSARNRLGIAQSIARLAAQGGTQIFPALDAAYQDLAAARARLKHVILLTDGQTPESGLPDLVQAMHAEAITVSTVGLGADVNKSLLQTLASVGAGRSYLTNDPENVPRIFVNETTSMRRDSAVEELTSLVPREPAAFLQGIDLAQAPLLRGYVATQAKPAPAQVLLGSEHGEPLLARWHVGLGYALAWTSDLEPRWAADLLRWRDFPRFVAQLVREHLRTEHGDELPMQVDVQDGLARVSVDALDRDDRFIDDLQSVVQNATLGTRARFTQIAPGRYEAKLPLPTFGAFALEAVHERDGQVVARSHAQAGNPYPREYVALEPNARLLGAIANATGGRVQPSVAQIWQAGPERPRRDQESWPACAGLALALFLLDLWVRRVRIFAKKAALSSLSLW